MFYEPTKEEIVKWLKSQKAVSASMLQRNFSIGYSRAARLIEDLIEEKWVRKSADQAFTYQVNSEKIKSLQDDDAWTLRNKVGLSMIRFLKTIEKNNTHFECLCNYLQPLKAYSRRKIDLEQPFQKGLPLHAFLDCSTQNIKTAFFSDSINDESFITVLIAALSGVSLEKILSGSVEGDHLAKILEATAYAEDLAGAFYSVDHMGRDGACEFVLDHLSTDCQVLICDTEWTSQLEMQDILTQAARKMGKTIIIKDAALN